MSVFLAEKALERALKLSHMDGSPEVHSFSISLFLSLCHPFFFSLAHICLFIRPKLLSGRMGAVKWFL